MEKERISRRDFCKIMGVGTLALGASVKGFCTSKIVESLEQYYTRLDFLDGVDPSPHPLPDELRGLTLNSPFLWKRDSAYIKWVGQQAKNLDAQTIRIFINDSFEPALGKNNYDDTVLENIKRTASLLPNTQLIVSLYDTYSLLHSDKPNLDYKPVAPFSPYFFESPGETKEQKRCAFFSEPYITSHFQKRLAYCVKHLKNVEHIAAWEIANEPEHSDKETLTKWYEEGIKTIRSIDGKRPIITGVAQPDLIDESQFLGKNIINSFHVYPSQKSVLNHLKEYAPKSVLPLAGLETGISNKREFLTDYPSFLYEILNSVISSNTLYVGNIGLWKIDNYKDGYDISNSQYAEYFQKLSEKLKLIQTKQPQRLTWLNKNV